ncbi:Zinc finger protein, partial [Plecturocebus cupreus]
MGFLHVGQAGLKLLTSGDLPALASQSVGITDGTIGMCYHNQLIFKLFAVRQSHYGAQAGLKLLGSSNPPHLALASQSAEIT